MDANNTPYIVYCHEWVEITDGTICCQQLSDDLTKTVTEPKVLFAASEAPWTTAHVIAEIDRENNYITDGPFLYNLANSDTLLLWSSFKNGSYAIGQAISKNGILGPFVHIKEPLFEKDGGHGMVFRDKNNQLKLAIHTPNDSPNERPIFIDVEECDGFLKAK